MRPERAPWRLTFRSDERPTRISAACSSAGSAGPGAPRDAGRARDPHEVASTVTLPDGGGYNSARRRYLIRHAHPPAIHGRRATPSRRHPTPSQARVAGRAPLSGSWPHEAPQPCMGRADASSGVHIAQIARLVEALDGLNARDVVTDAVTAGSVAGDATAPRPRERLPAAPGVPWRRSLSGLLIAGAGRGNLKHGDAVAFETELIAVRSPGSFREMFGVCPDAMRSRGRHDARIMKRLRLEKK